VSTDQWRQPPLLPKEAKHSAKSARHETLVQPDSTRRTRGTLRIADEYNHIFVSRYVDFLIALSMDNG
jgi:hypothetical protein